MRAAAALLMAACLPGLSGCVAAIIPLYAGAALVKTTAEGDTPAAAAAAAAVADAPTAAPVAAASDRSDVKIEQTTLTSLPPPDITARALPAPAVRDFQSYVMAQAAASPGAGPGMGSGGGRRASAIVPDASALRLVRGQCAAQPTAVFIDLDPGRGTFDPLAPGTPEPTLAAALAGLRERKVEIVWFSRLGTGFAAAAHSALRDAGLDPKGEDEIVLMNDLAERKQTRRDDVAKRFCPVAILGDERADFDELYLYLKNADAALALDGMIGRGWFLASPFASPPAGNLDKTP